MNSPQLLDQLVDAYAPEAISWWPLAPGWWVVVFITISLFGLAIFFGLRHYSRNQWKRQALAQLKTIQQEYEQAPNKSKLIAIVQLIKSSYKIKFQDDDVMTDIELNFIEKVEGPCPLAPRRAVAGGGAPPFPMARKGHV